MREREDEKETVGESEGAEVDERAWGWDSERENEKEEGGESEEGERECVREMSSAVSLRDDFIDICPLIYFRMKDANVTSDQLEDRRSQHVTFDLISSVDGPLSSQIRFGCVS